MNLVEFFSVCTYTCLLSELQSTAEPTKDMQQLVIDSMGVAIGVRKGRAFPPPLSRRGGGHCPPFFPLFSSLWLAFSTLSSNFCPQINFAPMIELPLHFSYTYGDTACNEVPRS